MPKVDEAAKAWEMRVAGGVGEAVQKRRKARGWTGVQLAERTAELGYPITRVAISKIEGNARAGKFDVAELLVLAEALEIPPVLLLMPGFPDGEVETRPRHSVDSREAAKWFAGQLPSTPGAELVQAYNLLVQTEKRLADWRKILDQPDCGHQEAKWLRRDIAETEPVLEELRANVAREKDKFWGGGVEFDE